jgi:hypothetical protein
MAHAQRLAGLRGGFGRRQGVLELVHVDRLAVVELPANSLRVDNQQAIVFGQHLAQLVQELAQIVASVGFGRVGPEQKGDVLAQLGGASVKNQISQQGL